MAVMAVKILKETDITKRFYIPSKSLDSFPPLKGKHTVDFHVVDERGRVWRFRIYTRKKNMKRCPKAVLTKGWREFVCSKELRVGDRVAFYREKEQTGVVKYRVEVAKAVKIFGTVFPHKPVHS